MKKILCSLLMLGTLLLLGTTASACPQPTCGNTQYTHTYLSDSQHTITCTQCNFSWTASHHGGTAYCQVKKICSDCQHEYGDYAANTHKVAKFVDNGDGTHTSVCLYCSKVLTSAHTLNRIFVTWPEQYSETGILYVTYTTHCAGYCGYGTEPQTAKAQLRSFTHYVCGEPGTITYDCTIAGQTFTRTYHRGPAAHLWDAPQWQWNSDCTTANATFVCRRDSSHTKTVSASITSTTSDASSSGRQITYTATVTLDGKRYTDSRTRTLTTHNHVFSSWEPIGTDRHQAWCTADGCAHSATQPCALYPLPLEGRTAEICLVCGRFGEETLPLASAAVATGHQASKGVPLVRMSSADSTFSYRVITFAQVYAGQVCSFENTASISIPLSEAVSCQLYQVVITDGIPTLVEAPFTYADTCLRFNASESGVYLLMPSP